MSVETETEELLVLHARPKFYRTRHSSGLRRREWSAIRLAVTFEIETHLVSLLCLRRTDDWLWVSMERSRREILADVEKQSTSNLLSAYQLMVIVDDGFCTWQSKWLMATIFLFLRTSTIIGEESAENGVRTTLWTFFFESYRDLIDGNEMFKRQHTNRLEYPSWSMNRSPNKYLKSERPLFTTSFELKR